MRDPAGDLHKHISSKVKEIVNIEINLNGSDITKSMRVGDKTMQGIIAKTMIYDMVRDITPTEGSDGTLQTSDLHNTLSNAALSKDNFILKFLNESETFRELFSVDFVSLEASKQQGQKVFQDRGVVSLRRLVFMISLTTRFI